MNQEDARIAYQAGDLFHQHGITATGVEALSKAAGISKRTLYERFGSKDGLIAAAFEVRDVPQFEIYTGPVERAGGTSREQLKQLFVELESTIRAPEFRGCPFTSASSELADLGHPAHPVIRRHKERLRRWMLSRARAAEAADPGQLASQLMIVFDGALVQSLLHRSAGPARDAREIAETLIDAATAEGDRAASALRRQPCASHDPRPANPQRPVYRSSEAVSFPGRVTRPSGHPPVPGSSGPHRETHSRTLSSEGLRNALFEIPG